MILLSINIKEFDFVKKVFQKRWGGDFIVSRGKIHKPESLKGFIAEIDDKNVGLITFEIKNKELEMKLNRD